MYQFYNAFLCCVQFSTPFGDHRSNLAHQSLRPSGTLLLVTKFANWHREHMPAWFDEVTMTERRGYCVFHGVRPMESAQR